MPRQIRKIFGKFPPECETTKIPLMNSGSIFLGGEPKFSMEKSGAKNQISETQGPRKLERFNFDSDILFLTCFVRAFPTKPRFKTTTQVFAIKNGDVNPLPPSSHRKNNRSPRLQHAQDRKVGDKVLIFSSRDTEVIRASPTQRRRQRPASTHMSYHGKIGVMVRKSCDNQLRYICIYYICDTHKLK